MEIKKRSELLRKVLRWIENYAVHTRHQYLNHIQDYLEWVGDRKWNDEDTLYDYQKYLKGKHNQSHINYIIRGPVGALFKAHGERLPIRLPRVEAVVLRKGNPLFWEDEDLVTMITSTRVNGAAQAKALMAVATVYGPRATELLRITPDHIDSKKCTIIIPTLKHNLIRRHAIPVDIQSLVFGYDWHPISELVLRGIFDDIVKGASIRRKKRQSFHAIRHTIIDGLRANGLSDDDIYRFIGWAVSGTLGHYVEAYKYNPKNDAKVFAEHPFLKYWSH